MKEKISCTAMPQSPLAAKLEREIASLSFADKLWLLAQVAQQVQQGFSGSLDRPNLAAMADDPDIQRELAAIATEFAGTEMDGLNEY
jgi:hypothetical protein